MVETVVAVATAAAGAAAAGVAAAGGGSASSGLSSMSSMATGGVPSGIPQPGTGKTTNSCVEIFCSLTNFQFHCISLICNLFYL